MGSGSCRSSTTGRLVCLNPVVESARRGTSSISGCFYGSQYGRCAHVCVWMFQAEVRRSFANANANGDGEATSCYEDALADGNRYAYGDSNFVAGTIADGNRRDYQHGNGNSHGYRDVAECDAVGSADGGTDTTGHAVANGYRGAKRHAVAYNDDHSSGNGGGFRVSSSPAVRGSDEVMLGGAPGAPLRSVCMSVSGQRACNHRTEIAALRPISLNGQLTPTIESHAWPD